jgi:cobalamin biosynthesis protein CobW
VIDAAAVASGRFADDPEAMVLRQPSAHVPGLDPGIDPWGGADPAIDHDNPLEEVFSDQLLCADLVILNKSDLLAPAALAGLRAEIEARLRPGVKLVAAEQGRVSPAVALGLAASAEDDLAARPSLHEEEGEHDHDDFDSFVITTGPLADMASFRARLAAAIRDQDVLRVKGFADVPGRDRRLVIQAVGGRIEQHFDRPWAAGEVRATRLVVIGKKGLDRTVVEAALARISEAG